MDRFHLILCIAACITFCECAITDLRVNTTVGEVIGKVGVSRDGREFYEWLGIPYAEPPIGELRFEPPVQAKRRNKTIAAVAYPPKCPQIELAFSTFVGSEDCLYLNVYSAKLQTPSQNVTLPVIVFIHGGYFAMGTGKEFQPTYFMDHDIVFVTMNYRLGVLGFLNTDDSLIRGNMGLKDQSLALKWVYDNARSFGGDPTQITLMGESAGGISVHMHMLSPMSNRYISKAISESGTALAYWGTYKFPKEQVTWFANETGCPKTNNRALVECLKSITVEDLYSYYSRQSIITGKPNLTRDKLFVPTIERVVDKNTFLATDPEILTERGQFAKIPWLVGTNSGEGLLNCAPYYRNRTARAEIFTNFKNLAIGAMGLEPMEIKYMDALRDFYFGNTSDIQSDEGFLRIRDLFSDRNYYYGTQNAAVLHGKLAPTFVYYYNKTGEFSFFDLIGSIQGYLPAGIEIALGVSTMWIAENLLQKQPKNYGVCHADELFLLSPLQALSVLQKSPDYNFSKQLVKLWVDFASGPSDQKELRFQGLTFPRFDPRNQFTQFEINDESRSGLIQVPFKDRFQFLKKFYQRKKDANV